MLEISGCQTRTPLDHAGERTRTSKSRSSTGPKPAASTISATPAREPRIGALAGAQRAAAGWPRVESNHRAQLRRLPLYPLSYGAVVDSGYPGSLTVTVAQLVEPPVVVRVVVGSSPIGHLSSPDARVSRTVGRG